MHPYLRTERTVCGLALILAPLLLAASTFFWQNGQLGLVGGTIQVWSFIFWIPAMLGLLSLLRGAMPRFAAWAMLLVAMVCIGGANFAMDGIYLAGFGMMNGAPVDPDAFHAIISPASVLVLYLPGLFFPLSLMLIGFLLWRTGNAMPLLALLLIVGALCFPLSRLPRIELLAHLADLLLLAGAGGMGWTFLKGRQEAQSLPASAPAGGD